MKNYLQFLYTGAVDVAKEDELFDFLSLMIKYKTKNLNQIQLPSKKLLLKVIEFGEKDTNNLKEFETLLGSVSFKKFDEDYLTKLAKKSKDRWLTKNVTWKKKNKKFRC